MGKVFRWTGLYLKICVLPAAELKNEAWKKNWLYLSDFSVLNMNQFGFCGKATVVNYLAEGKDQRLAAELETLDQ